jgi:hypothetical protein
MTYLSASHVNDLGQDRRSPLHHLQSRQALNCPLGTSLGQLQPGVPQFVVIFKVPPPSNSIILLLAALPIPYNSRVSLMASIATRKCSRCEVIIRCIEAITVCKNRPIHGRWKAMEDTAARPIARNERPESRRAGKMGHLGGAARRARTTSWPAEASSGARGVFTSLRTLTGLARLAWMSLRSGSKFVLAKVPVCGCWPRGLGNSIAHGRTLSALQSVFRCGPYSASNRLGRFLD